MLMISAKTKPDTVAAVSSMQFSHTVEKGGTGLFQAGKGGLLSLLFCLPVQVPLSRVADSSLCGNYLGRPLDKEPSGAS